MNSVLRVSSMSLLVMIVLQGQARAVWVPSTSLQEEASLPARRDRPVMERLQDDVRRLDEVARDLKEDQNDLQRLQRRVVDRTFPQPVKENNDGYSVR
jgi:hypothetical protein